MKLAGPISLATVTASATVPIVLDRRDASAKAVARVKDTLTVRTQRKGLRREQATCQVMDVQALSNGSV